MTPCGNRVCSGCLDCIRAWASVVGLTLAPWQQELVDRMFPPDQLGALLARRRDLSPTFHAAVIRAGFMESA